MLSDGSFNVELSPKTRSSQLAKLWPGPDTQSYPVLTLPPEIVSEIFLNFLPVYPERPPHFGVSSPLILCQICRRWRAIALSTPSLWKAIEMVITTDYSEEELAELLEFLQAWLKRSGSCPLSLSLRSYSHSPLLRQFLQTIVVHSRRWQNVSVLVPFKHLHLIQGDMPLLRDMAFGPSDFGFSHHGEALTLFDAAPHLNRVVLMRYFLKSIMILPWTQLTHLEAHCVYEYECTEILRDAPNLVSCTFCVCCALEGGTIAVVPVHSHLRDMVLLIDNNPDVRLWIILDCLTLPALRTLRVVEHGIILGSLKAFIARSQCTLEELQIDASSLSEMTYREAFPTIGTLTLKPVE
ncbi:hypothetical protein B0H13DRAFT_647975 [Mycena leptocephala]|nr:hypothetical protein B0H13DRAFT_647975 [Mycena leptocephala]